MKHLRYTVLLLLVILSSSSYAQTGKEQKKFWKQVRKEMPEFKKVFKKHKKYRFEIVYTRIEKDAVKGEIFHRYYFGDHDQYFYPASTVKFPMALKTFQKVNKLLDAKHISSADIRILPADSVFCGNVNKTYLSHKYLRLDKPAGISRAAALGGVRVENFMNINKVYEPFKFLSPKKTYRLTEKPGTFSVNEMMSEMLIYSNNSHFNWLFELAAGENPEVIKPGIDIHKRLMVCSNTDSLQTRNLNLVNADNSSYLLPGEKITYPGIRLFERGYTVGKKHYDFNDKLVNHGRNFSQHNQLKLDALQDQLIELIYPGYLPEGLSYNITAEQRRQLVHFMGMKPKEDKIVSDSNYLKAPDDFTNFLYTGQQHDSLPAHIRIVNVIGQAYGFVTDCAYIANEKSNTDFFLAVRIYVNEDGILNDDKYEYKEIAYPLMEKLGKFIQEFEEKHPQGLPKIPWVFQTDW